MKILLQKILETLGTTGDGTLQRRATQNWRLLQDIPWLWAISGHWPLVETIIQATNKNPSDFFSQKIADGTQRHSDSITAVWIYVTGRINGRPVIKVEQIWNDRDTTDTSDAVLGKRWHQLLAEYCHKNVDDVILNIAVVHAYQNLITVYSPKGSENFNYAICSF